MNLLTVVLLCHNRPSYAIEAINSILNQSNSSFDFVISDNSSNTQLREIVHNNFSALNYKSWFPGIPVIDHFQWAFSSVSTPYFVVFHDDDLMEPEYVQTILDQFNATPSAVAVATNSITINSLGVPSKKRFSRHITSFVSPRRNITFREKHKFVQQYLAADLGGTANFSSYAYNTELIKGIYPDLSKCRFYFDTLFLSRILERGPIIWINEPLVRMRCHDTTISSSCGVRDYKSFISLTSKEFGNKIKQLYIDEYHFTHLYVTLEKRGRGLPYPALKFFISVLQMLLISSSTFRRRILNKLLQLVYSRLRV